MSAPPADRRRPRRHRSATATTVLAWIAVAGLAALARLDAGLRATQEAEPAVADSVAAVADVAGRHEPVHVVGEWQHAPVPVLATRPPALPRVAERSRARPAAGELPRPFAALRLASSGLIMPRLALPRVLSPRFPALRSLMTRARPGEPVQVRLSAYCLRGRTRRGTLVRPGIVAADPRVFPLARHVELYAAGRYLGRFKVEDTGSAIKGTRIDIWTPDCKDAIRFGMRDGVAQLVGTGD
ncbi:MAG: 3D domain-containing protein [Gemmatirosa sp.]